MVAVAEAFVTLRPETSGFQGEANRNILGPLKAIAAGAAAAFAVVKVKDFLGSAISEAREAIKVTAQTEQVIRSTGGAARLSSKDFETLATSISNKVGIDDEAIQSAENLLATFTNVRNETGRGNKVFDTATQAIVDMSAVQGDLQSNTLLVGKALQDPVLGMTALQRVGVRLSETQKQQIRDFDAVGDKASAQKVILKELAVEFGGQAEAQATSAQRLKVVWGNLQETLGKKLVPVMEKVATFLADRLPAALDAGTRAFNQLRNVLQPVIQFFTDIKNAFQANENFGFAWADGLEGKAFAVGMALRDISDFVKAHLTPILIGLGIAVAALVSPFLVVAGAVVFAYLKFKPFRDAVQSVMDKIGDLVAWVQTMMPQFEEAIGHVVAVVQAIWRQFGDDFIRIATVAFDFVAGSLDNFLQVIRGLVQTVTALINGDWGKAWDGFKQILAGFWDQIVNVVRTGIGLVVDLVRGIGSAVGQAALGMFDGIKEAFKSAINWVIRAWNALEFKIPGFDPPGPGPKFGGFTLGVPDIKELRAMGGSVFAGRPYWVGERGPELMVPDGNGSIIPNDRFSGRGGLTIERFEQHVHTKDNPGSIGQATNQGLRDAAFLLGV